MSLFNCLSYYPLITKRVGREIALAAIPVVATLLSSDLVYCSDIELMA